MAGKKGEIPEHVRYRLKEFNHPAADHPIVCIFCSIEDPRAPSINFRYSIVSVLFMTLMAMICGASDWEQVVVMCKGMEEWLGNYVDMTSGVPCDRTFKNIFNILNTEALEAALREVSSLMREGARGVISFDGQTNRGTADDYKDLRGIHILNAWCTENQICLGQLKIDDKSNEIPAMTKLLATLDVKGAIITADALNTQTATAKAIIQSGADYLLPVKGNQETLLKDIDLLFQGKKEDQAKEKIKWQNAVAKAEEHRDKKRLEELLNKGIPTVGMGYWSSGPEKSHGRIETRTCTVISIGNLPSKDRWEKSETVVRIDRERTVKDKTTHESLYYITSLPCDAALIGNAAREHWGVENSLHWRLDVIFRQDQSRFRDRVGASNLSVVRKIALNALVKENTLKKGVATKQCAAAMNPKYRELILKNLF